MARIETKWSCYHLNPGNPKVAKVAKVRQNRAKPLSQNWPKSALGGSGGTFLPVMFPLVNKIRSESCVGKPAWGWLHKSRAPGKTLQMGPICQRKLAKWQLNNTGGRHCSAKLLGMIRESLQWQEWDYVELQIFLIFFLFFPWTGKPWTLERMPLEIRP
jgi:hypothetical protein